MVKYVEVSNKSRMVVNIMIIIMVLQISASFWLINSNKNKQIAIEENNLTQEVMVVSESGHNKDRPADERMLLSYFVNNAATSLLTYNVYNLVNQMVSLAPYMSSGMFSRLNNYFFEELRYLDRVPNSVFKINPSKTEIVIKEPYENNVGVIVQDYDIIMQGKRRYIWDEDLGEEFNEQVSMTVQKVMISSANPYGFILTKFDLDKIKQ